MPRCQFSNIDLCGVLGTNTPKEPGTDDGLFCVIEESSRAEAIEWGFQVHGDFLRARTAQTDHPHDGSSVHQGELWDDTEEEIATLIGERPGVAVCKIGEFPDWSHPWKLDVADGVRSADA